jgi:hypothetical protein
LRREDRGMCSEKDEHRTLNRLNIEHRTSNIE